MVVPVADQERLRAILAFDLQPRIQWAYDLEQDVDGLGAGYVTVGNGDPNGLVTKPEGYLFLDLTTPAVWQNQNGGTVWTDISAGGGGGSGLPPQWTDGGNGDVTATVDDPTKTAFEILAAEDQEVPPLVITSDTELGSTDLILVRQSVAKGGADLFTLDDSGELDLHVVDPGAAGLTIDEAGGAGAGSGRLLELDGSMENRNEIAAFLASDIGGVPGQNASTVFDGGFRVALQSFGNVAVFDPIEGSARFTAHTDQTETILAVHVGYYPAGVDVFRVLPSGAIGTSAGEPADADINDGECFRWFDPTNGAAFVKYKGKTLNGTVVTSSGPMT